MKPNKITFLFVAMLFFSLTFFTNCHEGKKESDEKNRYPNDTSELSQLMRDMWNDSDLMKKAVLEGKLPDDFRQKFTAIHKAVPTDENTKKENFDAMAQSFIKSMDNIYAQQADKESLTRAFNLMVNQCVACHQTHCPGPIVKIQKLTIQ
jgi:cytochrome c556